MFPYKKTRLSATNRRQARSSFSFEYSEDSRKGHNCPVISTGKQQKQFFS